MFNLTYHQNQIPVCPQALLESSQIQKMASSSCSVQNPWNPSLSSFSHTIYIHFINLLTLSSNASRIQLFLPLLPSHYLLPTLLTGLPVFARSSRIVCSQHSSQSDLLKPKSDQVTPLLKPSHCTHLREESPTV